MLRKLVVGPYQSNCYILGCEDTKEGIVIDPGEEGEKIQKKINEYDLKLKYIVGTHGHFDHISGARILKDNNTDAKFLMHKDDQYFLDIVSGSREFGG